MKGMDLDQDTREVLKASLAKVKELKSQLAELEGRIFEPIALIGIGCRFPGGAAGPEAYWELLDAGHDAVQPLDPRWTLVGARPREDVPRWAGLLTEAVDGFDAAFFGISPWEARSLDPQHRLLLEVAWEALEHAGIPPRSLDGSRTGVMVGASTADYSHTVERQPRDEQDACSLTGNLLSIAAGRVSYTLGLRGPCLTVDTACSSSLVAVHLACGSLRARESDLALAGGVNLLLSPALMEAVARLDALSPDGRCRTFDAAANGFVRGEGCGLVVLKRLSDAQRDGDRIWALIRGSAVNQDGRSTALTAPSVLAQEALLREALGNARVEPGAVGYVETHGTGTSLGDPIEVEALRAVVGPARPDGTSCVLGAVKTNLGHLEAAAGVAGLIKAALALGHERIPKNLNFRTLNPRIRIEGTALLPATEPVPWPRGARPRFAGVSSFGLSGTNAHVILEEAPAERPSGPAAERAAELVVLSARSKGALNAAAGRLREHIEAHPSQGLGEVACGLATTRSPLEHRLAVAATSREGLRASLEAAAAGRTPAGTARGVARAPGVKLAFLFTGQGAQTPGMGRGLEAAWPAFRDALDACTTLFDRELDRPLREVMWAEPGSAEAALLDQTGYTQPALFAVEYALAALWRSWGVVPELVAGHSLGELVAACVAGVFSLEDAVRLSAARGRLMQALPAGGAMLSIAAPEAEVAAAAAPYAATVSIAAINGPEQIVIAGAAEAVSAIAASFEARAVRARPLRVSHAFHSPLMEPMLEEFRRVAESVAYRPPSIALVSNLSGQLCAGEASTPSYWVRHAREAVRFADGVRALHEAGAGTFIEVGPKPTLIGLLPACLADAEPASFASLRAGREAAATMLEALGGFWAQGGRVDWSGVFPGGGRRVPLPTYPWQHERHWVQKGAARSAGGQGKRDLEEWFYRPRWLPPPLDAAASSRGGPGSQWLIFADDDAWCAALGKRLDASGQSVTIVTAGASYAAISGQEFTIRPGAEEDYDALFAELFNRRLRPTHIIHAWSLREARVGASPREAFVEAQERGFYSLLFLTKTLRRKKVTQEVWIEVLTRGMQAVGAAETPSPEKATILGSCLVIPQEQPNLRCRSIDLDRSPGGADQGLLGPLLEELARPPTGRAVALRGSERFELSFERCALPPSARPPRLREGGVYLVTGGLGDLGLRLAEELARQVRAKLILLGRSGLPEREEWAQRLSSATATDPVATKIRRVEAMEALGAEVLVVRADVADEHEMEQAIARGRERFGAIHGVVHAAGCIEDAAFRSLPETGRVESERHFAPKAHGLLVLERVLGGEPLDFCLLMSSLSAVLGGLGLLPYASSNLYLDAFAQAKRREGAPWMSVDWDLWGSGKASELGRVSGSALSELGITQEEGLEVFRRVLGAGDPMRLVVSTGDLDARIKQWVELEPSPSPGPAAPAGPRDGGIERGLQEIWSEVLGVDGIGEHDDFFRLGGHSLLAARVFVLVKERFGKALPLSTLFEAPTVAKLAALLRDDEHPEPRGCLVPMQPLGSKIPLFWAHGVGGDLLRYYHVVSLLGKEQPVYGFHAPPEPFDRIETMAAHYLEEMLAFRPDGPYALIGHCFGGFLAFEMARQLREKGREVIFLGIVDADRQSIRFSWEPSFVKPAARHVATWLDTFVHQDRGLQKARIREASSRLAKTITRRFARGGPSVQDVSEVLDMEGYPEDRKHFAQVHFQALGAYVPERYPGRLTLFRVQRQRLLSIDPSLGWGPVAAEVEVAPLPGHHDTILEASHAGDLADRIARSLSQAHGEPAAG
jgi:acyl transferase domain-containing protein/thioesterase domain-containing protein/acyl carrier protein